MPEGDTIFRAARTLHRALAGRLVTRFESVSPGLMRVDEDSPIAGRTVHAVSSRGKHLLIAFSEDLILHTHMRMSGSWHVYRNGERWRALSRDMRVVVGNDTYVAVGFKIPVAEFLSAGQLARHEPLQALGPDLSDPGFDRDEVRRRMAGHEDEPIHDVLLNQRVLSGIGNVLKSEVLFVARVSPFTPVGRIDDDTFSRLMAVSLRLMKMNIVESASLPPAFGRRTTGSLDPTAKLFVYGRAGKPCRACGTPIEVRKTGVEARLTYWCPECQAADAGPWTSAHM